MTTPPTSPPTSPLLGDADWVDDGRLWTAAELDQLTAEQRTALVRQQVQPITDLSTLDPALVERIRATGKRLLDAYRRR